ncbi:MAG TPA: SRPBCC domain-containing protein [Acidimicrobiia bacterium]
MNTGDPVEREIELDATPEEVWEELADPDRLGEWLGAGVDLDLEPGGTGTFSFPDGGTRRARVVAVEAGRMLSFTWWPVAPTVGPPTLVTITIAPRGTGSRLHVREAPAARLRAAA